MKRFSFRRTKYRRQPLVTSSCVGGGQFYVPLKENNKILLPTSAIVANLFIVANLIIVANFFIVANLYYVNMKPAKATPTAWERRSPESLLARKPWQTHLNKYF